MILTAITIYTGADINLLLTFIADMLLCLSLSGTLVKIKITETK